MGRRTGVLVLTALFLIALAVPALAQLKLNGAGATFPYVIYSKWFDVYSKKTGVEFNYQSIGSGGGIKQVIEGTVDFGAIRCTDDRRAAERGQAETGNGHSPYSHRDGRGRGYL